MKKSYFYIPLALACGFILTWYVAAQSILTDRNFWKLIEKELMIDTNLLDEFIDSAAGISGHVLGFLDEIASFKWVYYGQ